MFMSTTITPSDSATTDMAPHVVLEPGVVAADAGGRLGRELERHEDEKDV